MTTPTPGGTAGGPDAAARRGAAEIRAARRTATARGARSGHWAARLGLLGLALAILAMPFYAAAEYYEYQKYMTPQAPDTVVQLAPAQTAAWSGQVKSLPATSAPIVLTYHDISPKSTSPYVVTPQTFSAQMAALQAAGYRSLSSQEFADYLRGGPAPPRSVFITFDDGTNGLWVYGDRIMAKYHMHGTSFLIAERVDHDRPYYLTWNEISRMAASGRWDFQDHTYDLHYRAAVDAKGDQGSALANRLWLPALNRLETYAEYQTRVEADIKQSIATITGHGLPKPLFFAYPYSESSERANLPRPGPTIQTLLSKYFVATLTDVSSRPLTASRRAAAMQNVQRLEVLSNTSPAQLLSELAQWTQVAPSDPAPLTEPAQWSRTDGSKQNGLGPFTGSGPYPSGAHYAAADFRSMSSLDWDGYRVDATVSGLEDGTNQVSVSVRDDSAEPLVVGVSRGTMSLSRDNVKLAEKKLADVSTHTLQVTVQGRTTTARVDGTAVLSWTSKVTDPTQLTGGFGIRVGINQPGVSWPRFSALSVTQAAPAVRPGGPDALTVDQAVLLDPNAEWEAAPGVAAPFRTTSQELEPVSAGSLSAYGAYQPERTGAWTDYTVDGTVARLTNTAVSGAVWVRVGSPLAISVQVFRGQLEVFSGDADSQQLIGTRPLTPSATHRVTVTVTPSSTLISVDGSVTMSLRAKGETGGVAFSAYRDLTRRSWPVVQRFTVTGTAS
ncbi:polysaccharide deacetylase family protein [Streptacidiphilus sp. PB12-B1b]|uniref:polysaccharide deacetylase family protein n=1 Tax=Streptacidiphilus sp. PB12-B1b TaxID=2705012 RepID=UPI0015F7C513|nr:polysaccharide deacetylase family protein [Streptacidiphilus sp. PB12-B1b]QMU75560.1 polysaccharide deacetylase family protein [Streptacidiphilus sp. PB12-B1b]